MDGFLQIIKRGVLSEATEFAISIDDYDIPQVGPRGSYLSHLSGSILSGGRCAVEESRQTSQGFSVGRSVVQFRNLTTFNCLDAMRCGFHPSLQARLTTATMRQIITPLNLDSAQTPKLIELIEKAHGRGMRIILDFVANHWSNHHPTFQEAQRDPDSEYRAWYTWQRWPDEYTSFFGVKGMPQLNLTYTSRRAIIC